VNTARDPRAPCLIGVGRRTWHPEATGPDGAPEPLEMWEEVARSAAEDAGAPGALAGLESLRVVYCQSWDYDDPAERLAARLGAAPADRRYSGIGGSMPQVLVSELAGAVLHDGLDLALVVGAEALATVRRLKKEGRKPAWSFRPEERRPFPFDAPFHPAEVAHSVFQAYLTFAVFDNARRAHLGTGLEEHRARLGRLLAPMTDVAAAHPADSWFPVARTPDELTTATPDNRMVAYPYTKLMVSIMDVDMAAALLVASDAKADELGVPLDRRVYLRGWGYAEDPHYVAERRDLWRSPAMRVAGRSALAGAGVAIDDVAHLDLYSCFASSLAFAADALGLDQDAVLKGDRSLTVTGGLPYHGGPGSNYMTHAIAAMAERLRADPGSYGLTSGVGMHMTKHAYGLWSASPGPVAPPDPEAAARELTADLEVVPITDAVGAPGVDATVAAYTVLHGRAGSPEWGALVCDLPDGSRCYARLDDAAALDGAEREELVGRTVRLSPEEGGVNLAHV
jgi:acetyl-CoA C-acetyltransferase